MKNGINVSMDKNFQMKIRKNFNTSIMKGNYNNFNNDIKSLHNSPKFISPSTENVESDDNDNIESSDDIYDGDIRNVDDLIAMLVERDIDIETIDVVKVSKIFDQFYAGLISPVKACELIQVSVKDAFKHTKKKKA